MQLRQQGQFKQADFFENIGGLNITDTPFAVKPEQATGGYNYDYVRTGGFRKRKGHAKSNSSPDTLLKSLGVAQHYTASGTKTVIRATDTKLQKYTLDGAVFTALSEDTASAGETVLTSGSTQPVVTSQFNGSSADTLWCAGGGMASVYGVYSASKFTKNGVPAPTGAVTAPVSLTGGSFASTGVYRYAVVYRKTSTQALSNAALDVSATIANTTDKVTLDLTGLTNLDATKYDKIYIYRSAVGGAASFTTGDLVTKLDSGTTSYVDTGTATTSSTNVPRAGNTTLDNSELSSGTYNVITTWKRRLVTASGSTLYLSDLNKSESWPTGNTITIPSGGAIKALAIISFTTASSDSIDEILCIFKERELWVLTGSSISDWSLKFIDSVGTQNQALVVPANGFLSWIDFRGVYLWEGSGKPVYCSRPIEDLFSKDGDLDKSKLAYGWGTFFNKTNQIVWGLSHKTFGEQTMQLKLDLRLSLPKIQESLAGRIMDGVFIVDYTTFPLYAGAAFIPPTDNEEVLLSGDDDGYLYKLFSDEADADAGIGFTYDTAFLDCNAPGLAKRYHKVIAWVDDIGDWKLYLDYWTDYRSALSNKSSQEAQIAVGDRSTVALWDIAYWDVAYWDDYYPNLKALVFNLSPVNNNAEGDCIKLRFRQGEADQPVTIHGFSVLYSDVGLRK
jgi:hypothetical protein